MATEGLKKEIKILIMEALNIDDVSPEEVGDDESLFGEGNTLGLDSIDALEIVMALQEKYGVRIDDKNQSRFILKSISTIAEFIEKNRTN
ncbi:MAG TPA: phosphopantetheine-binding protein [Spirochaetota bacterium]|nr:phosphopantetheine-binding protein [Spirochaetota bacterium]HPC42957.1 phosphopantetheine-binding protein [Spirochaetota bacterium]HPL18957.1 phosphopantetheine-binding protein [Spirochaetota bacterium]HQF07628.1 phosphopantetheine-binding protein [Spirochaetota bacterium]HQH96359.1 phosphopantetheine-binding protein [Spirochaetota bacterium]